MQTISHLLPGLLTSNWYHCLDATGETNPPPINFCWRQINRLWWMLYKVPWPQAKPFLTPQSKVVTRSFMKRKKAISNRVLLLTAAVVITVPASGCNPVQLSPVAFGRNSTWLTLPWDFSINNLNRVFGLGEVWGYSKSTVFSLLRFRALTPNCNNGLAIYYILLCIFYFICSLCYSLYHFPSMPFPSFLSHIHTKRWLVAFSRNQQDTTRHHYSKTIHV